MSKAFVIVLLCASTASAQEFARGGTADPREPRIGIGLIRSNLFADPLKERPGQGLGEFHAWDTHGVVQLGISRGLLRFGRFTAGLQGGAVSRFRLDTSDNDALSVDYFVAVPVVLDWAGTQTRLRLIHRSAHLGDEVVINSGIRRLEFDHEEVDLLVRLGLAEAISMYAGGTLTVASSFDWDDGGVQAGIDGKWPMTSKARLVAALDWQRHSLSDWTDQVNAVLGVEVSVIGAPVRVQGRFNGGASHLGEFFLDREKAWGAEVILGW